MDTDDDGLITLDQCRLLLRNYLTNEAVKMKNEKLQIARDCFIIQARGQHEVDPFTVRDVLQMVDQKISDHRSDPVLVMPLATVNETVHEESFVQAYMLHQCLVDPSHRYVVVSRKKRLTRVPLASGRP
eukprot:NODE_6014_length_537_cov_23.211066_g5264_i0.p1 GENE.NODE_6014_length_537_cov_23.211066_g5264_i0~~NODE_6014_length_537_cov_23.211066_g5264_i0.p1  ORF type:complete len:129 (+),score=27.55 NODE_6014_length_537_cov_23.211066_g5264_i0:59-445(+)